MWTAHYDLDIPIATSQSELVPIQRYFLALAADEHGPDPPDTPNVPNTGRVPKY